MRKAATILVALGAISLGLLSSKVLYDVYESFLYTELLDRDGIVTAVILVAGAVAVWPGFRGRLPRWIRFPGYLIVLVIVVFTSTTFLFTGMDDAYLHDEASYRYVLDGTAIAVGGLLFAAALLFGGFLERTAAPEGVAG